jgi:hypothetical protein
MIGEPKFWYGGMLQQAAAGRFLGYGGMRQPGVGDFTYTFTHHARARRGLETSIATDVWGIVLLSSRQKVARHDKRFRMQLPVNLSWVGGPHIKTLVGVSQGYARMLPGLSRPSLIPFMEGGRQGYGGMLFRAATRPSTVYGGMPEELFGHPIIP